MGQRLLPLLKSFSCPQIYRPKSPPDRELRPFGQGVVMKTLVGILMLTMLSLPAHAFQHFRAKGELKELIDKQNQIGQKAAGMRASAAEVKKLTSLQRSIASKILNLNQNRSKSLIPSIPGVNDEKLSLIWEKILDMVGTNYNQIGEEQSGPLVYRHTVGGDTMNFSGFTWQQPQANFSIGVNRSVAPDFTDIVQDRWLVQDRFLLTIDATTLITNLADLDLIEITDDALAAFIGIGYQRVYHTHHFADSYTDGLTADFAKLFLPFLKFTPKGAFKMGEYEVMKKKDIFLFNAGGFVKSPPYYGVSLKGGVIVNVGLSNEVRLQRPGPLDEAQEGELLRLSIEQDVSSGASAHLAAQIDFFELIKVTLLSYDLEYQYTKSHQSSLSFYQDDKDLVDSSKPHKKELRKLLMGRSKALAYWRDNVISLEERIQQDLNSTYNILLWGNMKRKETQQTIIKKNGVEKVFFTHFSESVKIVQDFFSRLFHAVIYSIFDFDTGVKNSSELNRSVQIDYAKGDNDTEVNTTEDFSLVLSNRFFAKRTHRKFWHKKNRNTALYYMENFTNLHGDIRRLVRNRELRGPLRVNTYTRINKDGLNHMMKLNDTVSFARFIDLCKLKNREEQKKWLDPNQRGELLKTFSSGNSCVKSLGRKYLAFMTHYRIHKRYDMMRLKKFLGKYLNKSKRLLDIEYLFGKDNLFINGDFSAQRKNGQSFMTYFKSGQFRGLGVIDDYRRKGVNRAPVSVSN
jgi:hypothetical protein